MFRTVQPGEHRPKQAHIEWSLLDPDRSFPIWCKKNRNNHAINCCCLTNRAGSNVGLPALKIAASTTSLQRCRQCAMSSQQFDPPQLWTSCPETRSIFKKRNKLSRGESASSSHPHKSLPEASPNSTSFITFRSNLPFCGKRARRRITSLESIKA